MPSQRQLPPAPALPPRPGPWRCMPASNVHSGGQKTVRRSSPSRVGTHSEPETRTEQAFPHRQEEFEPARLSARRRKSPAAAQESVRAEGHRQTGRSTESVTPPPERGPRLRAPVRPNLPKVGRLRDCIAMHCSACSLPTVWGRPAVETIGCSAPSFVTRPRRTPNTRWSIGEVLVPRLRSDQPFRRLPWVHVMLLVRPAATAVRGRQDALDAWRCHVPLCRCAVGARPAALGWLTGRACGGVSVRRWFR